MLKNILLNVQNVQKFKRIFYGIFSSIEYSIESQNSIEYSKEYFCMGINIPTTKKGTKYSVYISDFVMP